MSTVWVLLVVFYAGRADGGVAVVQQEFTSQENCEVAKVAIEKAQLGGYSRSHRTLGCFKK